jgi:hypothetical protein
MKFLMPATNLHVPTGPTRANCFTSGEFQASDSDSIIPGNPPTHFHSILEAKTPLSLLNLIPSSATFRCKPWFIATNQTLFENTFSAIEYVSLGVEFQQECGKRV